MEIQRKADLCYKQVVDAVEKGQLIEAYQNNYIELIILPETGDGQSENGLKGIKISLGSNLWVQMFWLDQAAIKTAFSHELKWFDAKISQSIWALAVDRFNKFKEEIK